MRELENEEIRKLGNERIRKLENEEMGCEVVLEE